MGSSKGGIGLSIGVATVVALGMSRIASPEGPASSPARPAPGALRLSAAARVMPAAAAGGGTCEALLAKLVAVAPRGKRDPECEEPVSSFLERHGLCGPRGKSTAFLVATVADPLDSRLAVMFDQSVNALVLAAEKQGALTDYWLPWLDDRKSARDSGNGLSMDVEGSPGSLRPHESRCHEEWPGLIAFADDADPDARKQTVLLLAGEIPTLGVRREVLRRALQLAGPLTGHSAIKLVGPQFSGSAASLREAVKTEIEAAPNRLDVAIVSGSATRLFNQKLLTADLGAKGSVSYEATVIPDSELQAAFYRYLLDNGFAKTSPSDGKCLLGNVAVLAESDTAYAQSFVTPQADGKSHCYPRYVINFPMHIADVRSAWANESSLRDEPAQNQAVNVPKRSVRVDLHERPDTLDDMPVFSNLTAPSDERALSAALGILEENRIDVVGIVATDSRDKLFLAEAVHRSAPDAQLFLFESDVLFSHPDYSDVLRGTLVVGTYPLITSNQFWSGRGLTHEVQERTQFDLAASEGTYNAALLALGHEDKLYEYNWPLMPGLQDNLADTGQPPLWVTAVGDHGFWPVATLEYKGAATAAKTPYLHQVTPDDDHSHGSVVLQKPRLEPSRGASLSFVFLCLFVTAIGTAFLQMARTGSASNVPAPLHPLLLVAAPAPKIPFWPPESVLARRVLAVAGTAAAFAMFLAFVAWLGAMAVTPLIVRSRLGIDFAVWSDANFRWSLARWVAGSVACTVCTLALATVGRTALGLQSAARQLPRPLTFFFGGAASVAFIAAALAAAAASLPAQFAGSVNISSLSGGNVWFGVVAGGLALLVSTLPEVMRRELPGAAQLSAVRRLLPRPASVAILLAWAAGLLALADFLYAGPADLSGIFRYWRSVHLSCELSPVVPTVALLAVVLLIIGNALRVLDIDQRFACCPALRIESSDKTSGSATRLREPWQLGSGFSDFADLLRHPLSDVGYWSRAAMVAAVLVLPGIWVLANVRGRIDHFWGSTTLPWTMGAAVVFCLVGVWHMSRLWITLSGWLDHLSRLPLRDAFKRVHPLATRLVGRGSRMTAPRGKAVDALAEQMKAAAAGLGAADWPTLRAELEQRWTQPSSDVKAMEDAAALRFTLQIAYAMARLRGIWLCVTIAAVLFVVSISSYPVHPHKAILVLGWVVVGAVVAATISLFIQMNRNEVLSLLSDTNPNQVTWNSDLIEKIVWFAALPLFGLVTAQFPEVAHLLARLVGPILSGTH